MLHSNKSILIIICLSFLTIQNFLLWNQLDHYIIHTTKKISSTTEFSPHDTNVFFTPTLHNVPTSFSNQAKSQNSKDFLFVYPNVTQANPCAMTVIVMDPRLPILTQDDTMWPALESLIRHAPSDMCLLLQTSVCVLEKDQNHPMHQIGIAQNTASNEYERGNAVIAKIVLDIIIQICPKPNLKRYLQFSGRVRVSILNHEKYNLTSCSNFYNPSKALLNVGYWRDEFIPNLDNDLILVFQSDAILCNDFNDDVDRWRHYAYVGAPWRDDYHGNSVCQTMEEHWIQWNNLSSSSSSSSLSSSPHYSSFLHFMQLTIRKLTSLPFFPPTSLQTNHINMCKGGYGPQGNGGLSLRSRKWMIRAIETCPSLHSGFPLKTIEASPCKVTEATSTAATTDVIQEDVYFATVLTGMGAPMPLAFEAALFSSEMMFLSTVMDRYGPTNWRLQEQLVQTWLGDDGLYRFHQFLTSHNQKKSKGKAIQGYDYFIPIGMHKFWFYRAMDYKLKQSIEEQCPLALQIIPKYLL